MLALVKLAVLVVFACLMALAGAYLRVGLEAGHWWILVVVLAGALALGYAVGNQQDRAEYHAIIAKVRGWLGR